MELEMFNGRSIKQSHYEGSRAVTSARGADGVALSQQMTALWLLSQELGCLSLSNKSLWSGIVYTPVLFLSISPAAWEGCSYSGGAHSGNFSGSIQVTRAQGEDILRHIPKGQNSTAFCFYVIGQMMSHKRRCGPQSFRK